ncbi:MAG: ATP-binding protein [Polyangiaceae bacterium]|nr:ATP-binding protein [Polyangiaceae bacterium]
MGAAGAGGGNRNGNDDDRDSGRRVGAVSGEELSVEAELLFNLLADRYERRSTVVTSNLAFGEWVQVFGSEKLTTALLDRLAHHAHVLTTRGASYRTNKRKPKN